MFKVLRYTKVILILFIAVFIAAVSLQFADLQESDKPAGAGGSFASVELSQGYTLRSNADLFFNGSSLRSGPAQAVFLAVSILFIAFAYKQKIFRKHHPVHHIVLFLRTTTERESDD